MPGSRHAVLLFASIAQKSDAKQFANWLAILLGVSVPACTTSPGPTKRLTNAPAAAPSKAPTGPPMANPISAPPPPKPREVVHQYSSLISVNGVRAMFRSQAAKASAAARRSASV